MAGKDSVNVRTEQDLHDSSSTLPSSSNAPQPSRTLSGIPSPVIRPTLDATRNSSPSRTSNAGSRTSITHARSQAPSPNRAGATDDTAFANRALSANTIDQNSGLNNGEPSPQPTRIHGVLPRTTSPRLPPSGVKSPPASASSSRRGSLPSNKPSEPSSTSPSLPPSHGNSDVSERALSPSQTQQRLSRGAGGLGKRLETVQEGDHSISPKDRNKTPAVKAYRSIEQTAPRPSFSHDSALGKSTAGHANQSQAQADRSTINTSQPRPPSRKASTSSLVPNKTRAAAEGSRHMTVETETVASIPQNTTGTISDRTGSSRTNTGGSLRAKPSRDTVRPRKDKKKPVKKPPPIVSGPGSSKAELFEQRVASEIEGESTDSDETFVYESNPADGRSQSRHHSRTPSSASLSTVAERQRAGLGGRVFTGSEHASDQPVRSKRSMKFASNSFMGSNNDDDSPDAGYGTVRTNHSMRATPRPDTTSKYVGRIHQNEGHGSRSPVDVDSPFSQAQRVRTGTRDDWRLPRGDGGSRPGTIVPSRNLTQKAFDQVSMDKHGSGTSEDERTPLFHNLRNPRTRGPHHLRHANVYPDTEHENYSCLRRTVTLFMAASLVLALLVVGGGVIFGANKPLYDVSIMEIQNVLASEQEIMLDLLVQAINPNLATVVITDMDINIFAKSRFVGDLDRNHDGDGKKDGDDEMIQHRAGVPIIDQQGIQRSSRALQALSTKRVPRRPGSAPISRSIESFSDGVDDGTDPMPCPPWEPDCDVPGKDPDHDRLTMLLGRIFHFDSALAFEPSPVRHLPTNSSGELRLARPGNKTESGGSERWERVTKHPFELIVRGILKYQLPLSTRLQTRSVGASVAVFPEEDVHGGTMRTMMLSRLQSLEQGGRKIALKESNSNGQGQSLGVVGENEAEV